MQFEPQRLLVSNSRLEGQLRPSATCLAVAGPQPLIPNVSELSVPSSASFTSFFPPLAFFIFMKGCH